MRFLECCGFGRERAERLEVDNELDGFNKQILKNSQKEPIERKRKYWEKEYALMLSLRLYEHSKDPEPYSSKKSPRFVR